jgi:amino acid transporter
MKGQGQKASLERGALKLYESIIMGIAGTAPAYSIAATTGALIATVGLLAPASILYAGMMIAGIALAYMYLNRVDANAGAAYAWVGRIFHPVLGFFAGWALLVSSVIFMVSGTLPAATATLALIDPSLADDKGWVVLAASAWLLAISAVVLKGIRLTSVVQIVLTVGEVGILLVIGIAALVKFAAYPVHPFSLQWFSLTAFSFPAFAGGALIAVFFFWGWDVTANLNEETADARHNPGRGAVASMAVTFALFMLFCIATLLAMSDAEITQAGPNVIYALANKLFPAPWGNLAVIAVLLSTVGTLETNILQFTRTMFAKARDGALHPRYARLHPTWKTPWAATVLIAILGLALLFASTYVGGVGDMLKDSIEAVGIEVAYYYGLSGLACAWYYRRALFESPSKALLLVIWPAAGALFLLAIAVISIPSLGLAANVMGIGGMLLGFIPLWLNRARTSRRSAYSYLRP